MRGTVMRVGGRMIDTLGRMGFYSARGVLDPAGRHRCGRLTKFASGRRRSWSRETRFWPWEANQSPIASAWNRFSLWSDIPKPVTLEIRRGLPQPFRSHPRLDLFVGESSPHPMSTFGCTICHDGQGSGTDFTFASHTPNDPAQRTAWRHGLGWSANPNWDYPMLPARLAESRCLLCHHDVTDLEPGPRFRDPPAAKLSAGYQLVRQYGCFGCHEIKGYDDAGRRIGPDMRLEPAAPPAGNAERASPSGTLRKVGPSLADVAGRMDVRYLADRIGDPRRFPPRHAHARVFGLHEHLDAPRRAEAQRFETVEMQGIAKVSASGRPARAAAAGNSRV